MKDTLQRLKIFFLIKVFLFPLSFCKILLVRDKGMVVSTKASPVTRFEKALTNPPIALADINVGDMVKVVPKGWGETVWVKVNRKTVHSVQGYAYHQLEDAKYKRLFIVKKGHIIAFQKQGIACIVM